VCCYSYRQIVSGWKFCEPTCRICTPMRELWQQIERVHSPLSVGCDCTEGEVYQYIENSK
jgi:hypothetical protein